MKSSILKWYILVFLLASDFVMFAQPGDDCTDENGVVDPECLECPDCDPEAPINTKLIWLVILGLSFAVFYFNRRKSEKA